MALPADYHMHTPLCHHAKGEPWELATQAVQKGLSEIGFSEHNPMIRDDWDDWHMVRNDFDAASEAYDAGASVVHIHFRDQRPGNDGRAEGQPIDGV